MKFIIADSFTDSLTTLSGDEQKQAKITALDLQMDPVNHGMSMHRLDRAKDKDFWSVRVSSDIRIIVHIKGDSFLLCYAGHHDDAYKWASRRRLETHPTTGAAQFVEVRERVEEVVIPVYTHVEQPVPARPLLFADTPIDELLSYGVPEEWMEKVRKADEDTVLDLAEKLPAEAAEALLALATGEKPKIAVATPDDQDPFEHPDAKRRFRVIENVVDLERALEYPWDKWAIFLHPAQREMVEKDHGGPARVAGSAGTGKTVVALHRAVYLARSNPDARVLLTTFSDILANSLRTNMRRLIYNQPRLGEQIEVYAMDAIGKRLFEANLGGLKLATQADVQELLTDVAAESADNKFSLQFLITEWEQVVDAWQLESWEDYRDVARLGRKTRLPEKQRRLLWDIFEEVRVRLSAAGLMTKANMFNRLAGHFTECGHPPFDFCVVDEAQDIDVPQLRSLAAIADGRPNSLFFAGDLGQRIFQQPFSWLSLGVDIRGRSSTLRINYRTSHQIRMQADRLLDPEIADVDGNIEERRGTTSVFNGPAPSILQLSSQDEESNAVATWLNECVDNGVEPKEIAVFVRSKAQLSRAIEAVGNAGLDYKVLDENVEEISDALTVSTMHHAKGLEFRAVAVMACDDDIIPLQERIETVTDESDLQDVYDTERHLLYVACTRARDYLLVSSGGVPSEFLEDMKG